MTADPAHPPRPGEGTGPLPPLTTATQPAHTTGPLPPLPDSSGESTFRRALRQQVVAINEGRVSLREGLSHVVSALVRDLPTPELLPDVGPTVLREVPDAILHHWLRKVARGEVALEVFLGALTAEGVVSVMRKSFSLVADLVQQRVPGSEGFSQLEVVNAVSQFDTVQAAFRQQIGERVATGAAEELKAGLDAHTANQLTTLLRQYAG